ncbi:MAG: hypothetical protein ACRDD8_06375 [Bacteroidales bacterium]
MFKAHTFQYTGKNTGRKFMIDFWADSEGDLSKKDLHLTTEWLCEDMIHCDSIGLWFENKELVDYDGTSVLPRAVSDALKSFGYIVGPDFD